MAVRTQRRSPVTAWGSVGRAYVYWADDLLLMGFVVSTSLPSRFWFPPVDCSDPTTWMSLLCSSTPHSAMMLTTPSPAARSALLLRKGPLLYTQSGPSHNHPVHANLLQLYVSLVYSSASPCTNTCYFLRSSNLSSRPHLRNSHSPRHARPRSRPGWFPT